MIPLKQELFEMATVHRDFKNNVSVAVNPDSNRIGDPYFKFYNNTDYRKADSVIRLMFFAPRWTYHQTDGKELWKLNSQEKKLLMECLASPSKKYKINDCTVWDATKFDWNYEYLGIDIEIDEYLKGSYDKLYSDNPSYVPSTLDSPDYTSLTF